MLSSSLKGRYGKNKAIEIRNAAINSTDSSNDVKALELQQTIQFIKLMEKQIELDFQ